MEKNLINDYISLVKKQITSYMKLIFGKKYIKKYTESFIEKYINVRYYNYYEDNISGTLRKKILYYLKEECENLIINNIKDREEIEKICIVFYYILYFDNVIYCKDIHDKINKIEKLCVKNNIEINKDFKDTLYKDIQLWIFTKEALIERYETDEFYLKSSSYSNSLNLHRINLKYNIKFPPEFSEFAIKKAFTSGIVGENRLGVEYNLITVQVMKDIIKQNFKREYVVEFSSGLLKKKKKIKTLLSILDNPIIQERVCIKLRYEDFQENKEKVYELMREGFNIALILDNSFIVDYKNIEILSSFKYIIVNNELKFYKEFMRRCKKSFKNIIEI